MTATNDFLPFATAGGANVQAQAAYAADSARTGGFVTGIAPSNKINKAIRQASIMAAVLAKFIVDETGNDVIDDGTLTTIEASFVAALKAAISNFAGGTISNVVLQNVTEVSQAVTAASTTTLDYSLGGWVNLTHGANIGTLNFTNVPAAGKVAVFNIERHKDGSGTARTITWPASVKWAGGVPPPLTQTASGWDEITLKTSDGGTTWAGSWNADLR